MRSNHNRAVSQDPPAIHPERVVRRIHFTPGILTDQPCTDLVAGKCLEHDRVGGINTTDTGVTQAGHHALGCDAAHRPDAAVPPPSRLRSVIPGPIPAAAMDARAKGAMSFDSSQS
jgi:hypothetical protein